MASTRKASPKMAGPPGQSVQRTVQAALVLGGTAYRVDIPVNFKLAKNDASGVIKNVPRVTK